MRQNILLQCQTHGFAKKRVVADSQNGLFDHRYGRICFVYVDFFIECLPQKLEIHRSQQAFPKNISYNAINNFPCTEYLQTYFIPYYQGI